MMEVNTAVQIKEIT